jgi:hypothetical protein
LSNGTQVQVSDAAVIADSKPFQKILSASA